MNIDTNSGATRFSSMDEDQLVLSLQDPNLSDEERSEVNRTLLEKKVSSKAKPSELARSATNTRFSQSSQRGPSPTVWSGAAALFFAATTVFLVAILEPGISMSRVAVIGAVPFVAIGIVARFLGVVAVPAFFVGILGILYFKGQLSASPIVYLSIVVGLATAGIVADGWMRSVTRSPKQGNGIALVLSIVLYIGLVASVSIKAKEDPANFRLGVVSARTTSEPKPQRVRFIHRGQFMEGTVLRVDGNKVWIVLEGGTTTWHYKRNVTFLDEEGQD